MPSQVIAGPALTAGLRTEFRDQYMISVEEEADRKALLMEDIQSDKLTELYAYFETAPYPVRWPRGQNIGAANFKAVQFQATNFDWGRRIIWHRNDRMDDQTKSLFEQARMLGQHFATLWQRLFFQLLQGTADSDLLPSVPNAPDGVAFFSTTDGGGSPRFGATDGNLLTGTGVGTAAAVRADFFDAVEQFKLFQDTEGQPLWSDSILDTGYLVIYGAANEQVVREAFQQTITQGSSAGISNIILDAGLKVRLWSTQRIADNDIYVVLMGAPKKSTFRQIREPLREASATMENSDLARSTGEEYLQFNERGTASIAIPYQAVKINN